MIVTPPDTNPQPLESLASEHAAAVFRFLRAMVGDGETARDLVQDTFLRLHRHAEAAGPGLVFTVARSCALDHLRRRKWRQRNERAATPADWAAAVDDPGRQPDRTLEDRQFQRDLLAALADLPEDQRTVFHLSEVEGRPYAEIASVLDVPVGTIASRKHHAVRGLRAHLRRLGYDE